MRFHTYTHYTTFPIRNQAFFQNFYIPSNFLLGIHGKVCQISSDFQKTTFLKSGLLCAIIGKNQVYEVKIK